MLDESAERLINEGLWEELRRRCRALGGSPRLPPAVRSRVRDLEEEMSSTDWSRLGVLLGILWFKIDRTLDALGVIAKSTQNVDRNTALTVSKLDALIQAMRGAR